MWQIKKGRVNYTRELHGWRKSTYAIARMWKNYELHQINTGAIAGTIDGAGLIH